MLCVRHHQPLDANQTSVLLCAKALNIHANCCSMHTIYCHSIPNCDCKLRIYVQYIAKTLNMHANCCYMHTIYCCSILNCDYKLRIYVQFFVVLCTLLTIWCFVLCIQFNFDSNEVIIFLNVIGIFILCIFLLMVSLLFVPLNYN